MCGESVLRPGLVRLEWLVRLEGLVMNVGEMGLGRGGLVRGLCTTAVGGEDTSMVDLEGRQNSCRPISF